MWWCSRAAELLGLSSPLLQRDNVRYVLIQWQSSCLSQTCKALVSTLHCRDSSEFIGVEILSRRRPVRTSCVPWPHYCGPPDPLFVKYFKSSPTVLILLSHLSNRIPALR